MQLLPSAMILEQCKRPPHFFLCKHRKGSQSRRGTHCTCDPVYPKPLTHGDQYKSTTLNLGSTASIGELSTFHVPSFSLFVSWHSRPHIPSATSRRCHECQGYYPLPNTYSFTVPVGMARSRQMAVTKWSQVTMLKHQTSYHRLRRMTRP